MGSTKSQPHLHHKFDEKPLHDTCIVNNPSDECRVATRLLLENQSKHPASDYGKIGACQVQSGAERGELDARRAARAIGVEEQAASIRLVGDAMAVRGGNTAHIGNEGIGVQNSPRQPAKTASSSRMVSSAVLKPLMTSMFAVPRAVVKTKVSWPAPPDSLSLPSPPFRMSLPP